MRASKVKLGVENMKTRTRPRPKRPKKQKERNIKKMGEAAGFEHGTSLRGTHAIIYIKNDI
jgi:hypothetical protein